MDSTEGISSKSLLELPNELCVEVASHLHNFEDLNSLVRTSHFFKRMFNTSLYRRAVTADYTVRQGIIGRVLSGYQLAALTLLLDNGLSIDYPIGFVGETMLCSLCRLPDQERALPLARLLIQRGIDTKATSGSWSDTALKIAIHSGNCPIVALLLETGIDVNAPEIDHDSPLHFASLIAKNNEMVDLLMAHGADIEARSGRGETPLLACSHHSAPGMAALLKHGADAGAPNGYDRQTALHLVSRWFTSQHHELAESLLEHGANVNATDDGGFTPLHFLLKDRSGDQLFMAKFLLEHGADANAISYSGLSPLRCALAGSFKTDIVALLLAYGANVNATDISGRTPLHWCFNARISARTSTVKVLLENGADVNAVSNNGLSPLKSALWNDYGADVVALLLEYGANVNAADESGRTSLHWLLESCSDDKLSTARVLLENGADINTVSKKGFSPLRCALTGNCKADVVALLLEKGAIVNANDESGRTSLHWLLESSYDHLSKMKVLLENGADANAVSNDGLNPLKYVLRNYDDYDEGADIVGLLLEHGADPSVLNQEEWQLLQLLRVMGVVGEETSEHDL